MKHGTECKTITKLEVSLTAEWIQAWASLGQTLIGLSLVIITTMGLKQMRDASKQRNDQLDQMEAQSNALVTGLTAQTAALEKLLERK